jgi:hypothetical protein
MAGSDDLYYFSAANCYFADKACTAELLADPQTGLQLFRDTFTIWADNACFHDRTGTITTPFRTVTIPGTAMPRFEKLDHSLTEICDARAKSLLRRAKAEDRTIVIMYSGGIDSTTMLVSFMRAAKPKTLRERVLVLLNINSINENPDFYRDHILSKCTIAHSQFYNRYIGDDRYLIINGECNDQLWGAMQVFDDNAHIFGDRPWDVPIQRSQFIAWLQQKVSATNSEIIFDLLDSVCKASPISIETPWQWFWWVLFACKWQNSYMRGVAFAHPSHRNGWRPGTNFDAFYVHEHFQLWSMNNRHLLRGDKWACKDIIYDYNRDQAYRDHKTKQGSLTHVVTKKHSVTAIDSNLVWHDTWNNPSWFRLQNSFSGS